MKLPTRRHPLGVVDDQWPAPVRPNLVQVVRERDAAIGAEMHASQRAADAEADCERLAAERDELVVERDGLAGAALPTLDGPIEATAEPVDALLFNELCERLDFLPGQVPA